MTEQDKTVDVKLPEGMQLVSDGNLTESHDWDKEPQVYGIVQHMKKVPVPRGKFIEDSRMMIVDTGTGKTAVWESASLKDLFDIAEVGGTVFMQFTGLEKFDDARNPMKKFVTAYTPPARNDAR